VGEADIVINSEVYWGSHDDAGILQDIGAGSHGQMTAFAREYGGPLSWAEILDLAAYLRSWGAVSKPPTETFGQGITYTDAIGPMLTELCGACHGTGGMAGLTVTDLDSLLTGSESGPVLVPGDPDASRIVEVQSGQHYAQLSPAELEVLIDWIASGAER
jgi:mono/diheme cytochrome c family protein